MLIMNTKVSILIPVYCAETYIARCARSIFEQTYNNLEIIFVNDKTPDKSIEIINDILNNYSYRKNQTKIIHHDINRGVAAARNTLIENATGDYVLWVDADDYIEKNAVELLASKAIHTNADIVCFNTAWFSEKKGVKLIPADYGQTSSDFIQNVLSNKIASVLWGKLMKLNLFNKNKIKFVEGLNMGEDLLVLLEVAYYSQIIEYEESVLYYQEVGNNNSLSRSYSPESVDSTMKILDRIEAFFIGKLDISAGLKIRKFDIYIRQLYQMCLKRDKLGFLNTKEKIKILEKEGIRPTRKTPYDFYIYFNNYTICRLYSLLINLCRLLLK